MNAIDMHGHFFPRGWEGLHRRFGGEWPRKKLLVDNAKRLLGL